MQKSILICKFSQSFPNSFYLKHEGLFNNKSLTNKFNSLKTILPLNFNKCLNLFYSKLTQN